MLDREWDRPADERSQTASNASSHILAVHDVPGHLENILRVTATIKAQRPSCQAQSAQRRQASGPNASPCCACVLNTRLLPVFDDHTYIAVL